MQFGLHLTPFFSPPERPPTQILDEVIEAVRAASTMGYNWVSTPHHWLSHPTVWPQPYPLIARLAPETGDMRIKTSVLLLPLLNAVEVAENVVTLDHLTHGRLTLGVAIGYREEELQVAGLTRQDRVPKLVESLDVMKQLWTGEEVTYHGKYVTVEAGRLGFGPYQQPHPPIEFGAQSPGAVRRAARLGDGIFLGPQVGWKDIGELIAIYKQERAQTGHADIGMLGASRCLIVGDNKEDAAAGGMPTWKKPSPITSGGACKSAAWWSCNWISKPVWTPGPFTARRRTAWRRFSAPVRKRASSTLASPSIVCRSTCRRASITCA